MPSLSRADVVHVAHLARLGLTEDEVTLMETQLDLILSMFAVLDEVPTDAIAPTAQTIAVENILRPDVVRPGLMQAEVLGNAPERSGAHVVVPAIIGDGE
ncbi:MAG: Asp-tRNA(Asn)/Glu-tRNA(Gln) amidotransferase subunit GatC [Chloroflexota bacterium]